MVHFELVVPILLVALIENSPAELRRGTADDESIKPIRIFGDFEARTFGDVSVVFEPSDGRGWFAVNLGFQYNL